MSNIKILELAAKVKEKMKALGYSDYTIKNECDSAFASISKHFERARKEYFDIKIIDDYVKEIKKSNARGNVGRYRCLLLKRSAERLKNFYETGSISPSYLPIAPKTALGKYFEDSIKEYLSSGSVTEGTKNSASWVTRKFYTWLIKEGHKDLTEVGPQEIHSFIMHTAYDVGGGSLSVIKKEMKKLCCFLAMRGTLKQKLGTTLMFSINASKRILPAVSPAEIESILGVINRETATGKRDYAIIMLCVVTGLRGIDIRMLKLSDIDWVTGEIRLMQSKTGKALSLPLTKDVGEPLLEYIMKGRPQSSSANVFISQYAPHQPLSRSVIGGLFRMYHAKAGLPYVAFDGHSFHGVRRAVGRTLVTAGIPVTIAAQILGHSDVDSMKRYISLDSSHLKECALDLNGIEIEGEVRW